MAGATGLISLHPSVLYVHFAPLINICLSTSLMTLAIHQQPTEAAAPPQRGELDTARLIKTTQTTATRVRSRLHSLPLHFLCIPSAFSRRCEQYYRNAYK